MYDYDLARAVARNSQMDPKIYLPLLKRLNDLPTFYGRFEVDTRLKRFELALKNLFESYSSEENIESFSQEDSDTKKSGNKFENCVSLIEQHGLHQLGLELFKNDTSQRRVIFVSLGEHLLKERRSEAALSVFLAADPRCLEGAKRAARAAVDWRCYFALLEDEDAGEIDESPQQLEMKAERRRQVAREIADEIVARVTSYASKTKREMCSNAARILLDYGDDLIGAVDMLLQGECWSEGHRIASLHSRKDLIKKCTDAAVSYAYTAMEEFEERTSDFVAANTRYADVLKLRKQTVFLEGPTTTAEDDTESLFSAASNMSNMSLQSNTSTTSTGTSVSSIISVKSTSTFTMMGGDEANRHRSKFNKGKKPRKPKKKKKSRKPNAEEELKSLVTTLRFFCADMDYAQTISKTTRFLIFVQQLSLASEVFKRYNAMRDVIEKSRTERIEVTKREKAEAERTSRMEGKHHDDNHVLVELPIEKEMDELTCAEFPENLRDFFTFT
jgi:elongator complex protein 1